MQYLKSDIFNQYKNTILSFIFILYSIMFFFLRPEFIDTYSYLMVFIIILISLTKSRLFSLLFTNFSFIYILVINEILGVIKVTEHWIPNRLIYIIILNLFTYSITYVVQMRKDLEKNNQDLVEMVKILRHDLNTPISALISYIELMKSDKNSVENNLIRMERQVYYINNFISKSLEIVNYNQPITLKQLNLNKIILDVKDFYIENVTIEFVEGEEVLIVADRSKIIQMLINIIDNAIKHGQATKIFFQIEKNTEMNTYLLKISNDGKKIPYNQKDKIWQKFSLKNDYQSGLGLLVVKDIVQAHKWDIKLEIEPQTTFIIEIPVSTKLN